MTSQAYLDIGSCRDRSSIALVFETLKHGRALREVRGWPVALWTILLTSVLGAVGSRGALRTASWTCGGLFLAIVVAAMALQPLASVSLHVSPLLIGLLCSFGAILTRTAQRKDLILREIVNNSFDAIVTFDQDRRVISFNRAAESCSVTPWRRYRACPCAIFCRP